MLYFIEFASWIETNEFKKCREFYPVVNQVYMV